MSKILGIDEAGRGCVIGPMVVGGVAADEGSLAELEDLGVRDSKKLSPRRRGELEVEVKRIVLGYELRRVEPGRIDKASLNLLDIEELVYLIGKFSPEKVFFDVPTHPGGVGRFVGMVRECLGPALNSPKSDFKGLGSGRILGEPSPWRPEPDSFPSAPELIGENHADEKYLVVSAASILAKVARDRIIANLCGEYGDFGSGYPSDPKTQRFLRKWFDEYGDFPPMVRRKWSTAKKILNSFPQE